MIAKEGLNSILLILTVNLLVSCISNLTFGASVDDVFLPTDSRTVQTFNKISVSAIQNLYLKKCGYGHRVSAQCYLTERDIKKNGRTDLAILFRGEPRPYTSPAVSSYYRWAIGKTGFCKNPCQNSELMYHLNSDLQKLLPVFRASAVYREEDRSWRDGSGNLLVPLEEEKISALEIIAITHKQGSGLYFESGHREKFDPLVSFSLDPQVATEFAKTHDKKGILYLAAIPTSEIVTLNKSDCDTLIPEVGKIYDLNVCTQDFLHQEEVELDAFQFLPSIYFYGKITGL